MYQSPARVRVFLVAVAAASLLAACSGGGMNSTPATSLSAQNAPRSAQLRTSNPSPTVAPTATPASGNFTYKIVTGLAMDESGNFTEVRTRCTHDAPTNERDSAISLPVAARTVLAVCTTGDDDRDGGRGDDAIGMLRTVNPPPTATPTPTPTATPSPTPTPGVATDLVIIRKTVGDDDEGDRDSRHGDVRGGQHHDRDHGSTTVVLTGVANLNNNTWTFTALGITNDLAAEQHYKFYVAHQIQDNDGGDTDRHHHHGH